MKTLDAALQAKRDNFNPIRLLAALAVVYGHSNAVVQSGGQDFVTRFVGWGFTGSIAVDVFFIISGFLVTNSVLQRDLSHYAISRALRIYPGLIVCVGILAFIVAPLDSAGKASWIDIWRYFWPNASGYNVVYFIPGMFEGLHTPAVNGSLWSISLEIRMYIFLALAYVLGVFKNRTTFNVVFFVSLVFLAFKWDSILPTWLDEAHRRCALLFIFGSFYCVNRDSIPLNPFYALVSLGALYVALHTDKFISVYELALPYLVFMIAYAPPIPWPKMGDYSYGIYLYGWPAQQAVLYLDKSMSAVENQILGCTAALLCGVASWHLIERRAMRLKKRYNRKQATDVRVVPASQLSNGLPITLISSEQ